ncbi:MAG: glycosyl hydrolase [Chloroflexota bacterium]|nr:glycosyl hydrolase [Chloroflexota bacterium]
MEDKLRQEFLDPPLDLRGTPFWSWNDKLEVEELARQVRDMKAHGIGGFFMHSRDGLETVYMDPHWMECISETVQVASEEGMGAWLYDEDRWPSGAAGGLVPARGGDAYRAKVLTVEETREWPQEQEDILSIFRATVKNNVLESMERLSPAAPADLAPDETYLIFRREVSGPSEWFNNDAYADNLNPNAVAAFLDITYEAYRDEVGDEFGETVPGIFTDEPNVFAVEVTSGRRALPWTDGLPGYFQERRGYDLLDIVPWLFYDGENAPKACHDYWYTISERFTEAYSKQLGEWCGEHDLAFTGHYLCENEMGKAILRGGAIMPHYQYQQVPGIDMLTEQNHEFLTIKQCSSVANQLGRKRVLSETYGCSSWEFTFEGQKWVGDWQYVLGVNLRCQHLALYTLRGCRKRDFPPAFNYNTTWWKYNGVVEDYFARVGYVLTRGDAVRDVLLLHPITTAWCMLREGDESVQEVDAWGEKLNDFVRALLATHYDFDFGDEQVMVSEARVDEDVFTVGEASYKVVVIPPGTETILASTLDLLESFLETGGRVVAFEPLPTMVEAEPSERLKNLWKTRREKAGSNLVILSEVSELQNALETALPRRVSFQNVHAQEAAPLLYMQRQFDGKFAYFIFNGDRNNGYDIEVSLQGSGRVEEWDPLTGEMRGISAKFVPLDVDSDQMVIQRNKETDGGMLSFSAHFGPAGSRLYVVDPEGESVEPTDRPKEKSFRQMRRVTGAYLIGPKCPFTRTDPNLLTLDMCQYSMRDDDWSETQEVWRVQSEVRERLDMRQNYYNGLPQRYKWALEPHPNDGTPVALRFTFDVEEIPDEPVYLLIEGASWFDIALNGKPVANEAVGWYLDRSFHKVELPSLQEGENVLILRCDYTNYMELEDCYLLGDFGVSIDRAIIAEPDTLHFGDWTTQGYPHYAGSMIYHSTMDYEPHEGERVHVYLGEYEAVDVAVHVNGELAGHIPWASANGLDITDWLVAGENALGIEVVSSPRNMLGPLHLATGREPWTDWRSFRRTDETYTPDYVLKPWGLIGQVRVQRE